MKKNANPKHRNQVRITGGSLCGRKITFAQAEGLRPTPDSVRERLFNWLGQDLTGQDVLDLFAGSGALGFEALSRNARRAWLCDNARQTVRHLTATAQEFGIAEKTQIAQQDGITFLSNTPQTFHTVFLDPPFSWQDWDTLFAALRPRLNPKAFVYAEAGTLPNLPDWLAPHREGRAGQSRFLLLRYGQPAD